MKIRIKNNQNIKHGGDVVSLINKLPFEFHLPGHNYTGPGTNLELNIEKGLKPINDVDKAALKHDLEYSENKDLEKRHIADRDMINSISKNPSLEAKFVSSIMSIKEKLGLGLNENDIEKRFKEFLEDKKHKKIIVKPKDDQIRLSLESLYKLHTFIKNDLILFQPEDCYDYEIHKKNNSEYYQFFK